MRCLWVLGLFSLLSCGCIRTAVVQFWEPATIDVGNVDRIAVVDFTGEHGKAVTTSLKSRLRQNEFYTVIDRADLTREIQLASHSPSENQEERLQRILSSARRENVEGLVTGSVLEYRCEDRNVRKAVFATNNDESRPVPNRLIGNGASREWREALVREAAVTIEFRMIDVESGDLRASKRITHHYAAESDASSGKLPTQTEILNDLTHQCLNDIVEMLAPHEATAEIQLASCDV